MFAKGGVRHAQARRSQRGSLASKSSREAGKLSSGFIHSTLCSINSERVTASPTLHQCQCGRASERHIDIYVELLSCVCVYLYHMHTFELN